VSCAREGHGWWAPRLEARAQPRCSLLGGCVCFAMCSSHPCAVGPAQSKPLARAHLTLPQTPPHFIPRLTFDRRAPAAASPCLTPPTPAPAATLQPPRPQGCANQALLHTQGPAAPSTCLNPFSRVAARWTPAASPLNPHNTRACTTHAPAQTPCPGWPPGGWTPAASPPRLSAAAASPGPGIARTGRTPRTAAPTHARMRVRVCVCLCVCACVCV